MDNSLNRYNLGLFNSGTYTPSICDISGVTQFNPATITTSISHTFVVGQEVQFFIPPEWGMRQLNDQTAYVLSIPSSTQFIANIDTSTYDTFITPTPVPYVVIDPAQVAGIGDSNTGQFSPGGVLVLPITVPGAFENQPP